MSAIGDVRPPEVKPTEVATNYTALNEAKARPPTVLPTAMEAPDATLMNKPNTAALPLPAEATHPMSPDNGAAVGRAMHMLITVNVQSTQALVLSELKPAAAADIKQHDHRKEHRSAGHRGQSQVDGDERDEALPAIEGDEQNPEEGAGGQSQMRAPELSEDELRGLEAQSIVALLELLKKGEPLKPETLARVQRYLQSGAAALATDSPARFRIPVRP